MGDVVIKPSRDVDLYIVWSTIVESPLTWGNRIDIEHWLYERHDARFPGVPHNEMTIPASRLTRADVNGTSDATGEQFFGWDDEEFIYEQRGFLPRRHLARMCELLEQDNEAGVWDLLEPFEVGMEVRRG